MTDLILHEVGMRDGLQIEEAIVPTEQKIKWIEALVASGVDIIQVGSFVHPKKVPQMADTDALFTYFNEPAHRPARTRLSGLVLNEKGLERGLTSGVQFFCMGVSASNTGMSTADATKRIIATARAARAAGAAVQVSVQSAFGCGFEGPIPEARVLEIARRFVEADLRIISLADTAGHATPDQVERLFTAVGALGVGVECACHLHNTYALGLANAYAAMRVGVKYYEAAFGGLGGCPFIAVTGGNVCTEDLVHMWQRMGRRLDIRLDGLIELAKDSSRFFKHEMAGTIWKTGPVPTIVADSA
jgi:hydroxymethylglutaryl-CoA lyase